MTSNWSAPQPATYQQHPATPLLCTVLVQSRSERSIYTEDGHPLYIHARILEILSRLQIIHTCILSHILHFGAQIAILCSSNPANNAYSSCADSCIRGVPGVLWSIKSGMISRAHACYRLWSPSAINGGTLPPHSAPTWPISWLGKNKHESTKPTG